MRFLLALLLAIGALVASAHVASGDRHHAAREARGTQTQAPDQSKDDAWQSARRVATTTDSASQFRTLHTRAVPAISHPAPFPQLERRIRERVDAARDRSPQQPIPLLI